MKVIYTLYSSKGRPCGFTNRQSLSLKRLKAGDSKASKIQSHSSQHLMVARRMFPSQLSTSLSQIRELPFDTWERIAVFRSFQTSEVGRGRDREKQRKGGNIFQIKYYWQTFLDFLRALQQSKNKDFCFFFFLETCCNANKNQLSKTI